MLSRWVSAVSVLPCTPCLRCGKQTRLSAALIGGCRPCTSAAAHALAAAQKWHAEMSEYVSTSGARYAALRSTCRILGQLQVLAPDLRLPCHCSTGCHKLQLVTGGCKNMYHVVSARDVTRGSPGKARVLPLVADGWPEPCELGTALHGNTCTSLRQNRVPIMIFWM